jgi:hypothetical protein
MTILLIRLILITYILLADTAFHDVAGTIFEKPTVATLQPFNALTLTKSGFGLGKFPAVTDGRLTSARDRTPRLFLI